MKRKKNIPYILIFLLCISCAGIKQKPEKTKHDTHRAASLKEGSLSEETPLFLRELYVDSVAR